MAQVNRDPWSAYPYVNDPLPPPETPAERLLKGITALATKGVMPMRSRMDVWKQHQGAVEEQSLAQRQMAQNAVGTEEAKQTLPMVPSIMAAKGADAAAHPAIVQAQLDEIKRRQAQRPGADYLKLGPALGLATKPYDEATRLYHQFGGQGEVPYEEQQPIQSREEQDYLTGAATDQPKKVPLRVNPFAGRYPGARSAEALVYENALNQTGSADAALAAVKELEASKRSSRAGTSPMDTLRTRLKAQFLANQIKAIGDQKKVLGRVRGLPDAIASRDARLKTLDEQEKTLTDQLQQFLASDPQAAAAIADAQRAGAASGAGYSERMTRGTKTITSPLELDPERQLSDDAVAFFLQLRDQGVPDEEIPQRLLEQFGENAYAQ